MDINIFFKISKDTINISQIKKEVDYKSLNNTNIIDVKELKFSIEYIRENFELVSSFLNVVLLKQNVHKAIIKTNDISDVIIDLINSWDLIKYLTFKSDKKIEFNLFLKLLDNHNLKEINCYEMDKYLIERLDVNNNIKVNTRVKAKNISPLMEKNCINSYSDIYYKKILIISLDTTEELLKDVATFINVNDKLKLIRIFNYSNELLSHIIDILIKCNKKNITIEIKEKGNDLLPINNSINYLNKVNKKYFEDNNIHIKINYSSEYKKNNFLKQLNFKLFTSIISLIIIISIMILGINYYNEFHDQENINNIESEITSILKESETYQNMDDNKKDIDFIDVNDTEEVITTTKKSNYVSAYYINYQQVFDKLLEKNNDTVAWLQINNTKINYPIVKSEDNSFYLDHDYFKRKNSMGWIYMDYRNNPVDLDQNTIIYGHNIKQGIMFGTLKYLFNSSWYNKEENQIITFNTPTHNMKFKIFSLYKTPETDDYLKNEFATNEDFMNFLNLIKSRSINNFNVELNENSKIITLSTCFTKGTRHVVHAVLISSEPVVKEN